MKKCTSLIHIYFASCFSAALDNLSSVLIKWGSLGHSLSYYIHKVTMNIYPLNFCILHNIYALYKHSILECTKLCVHRSISHVTLGKREIIYVYEDFFKKLDFSTRCIFEQREYLSSSILDNFRNCHEEYLCKALS